jgi:acetyltransferase
MRWKLRNGTPVTIRPICPGDEPLMVQFHKTLSDESVHQRYFGQIELSQRIAHRRLARVCFNETGHEIALVADHRRRIGHEIIGVGRLSILEGGGVAEFAIVISDAWQGFGLGAHFLKRLVQIGREQKLKRVIGHILTDNLAMRRICGKAGFTLRREAGEWLAEILL